MGARGVREINKQITTVSERMRWKTASDVNNSEVIVIRNVKAARSGESMQTSLDEEMQHIL